MHDYVRALSVLKNLLPETALREFAVLEARMLENLYQQRLFGHTSDNDAQRFAIVDALNQLALQYHTKSFTELCFHPQTIKVSANSGPSSQRESSPTEVQQNLKKVVAPKATIQVFTPIIPTAYYHLLSVEDFMLFLVTIDNADPDGDDVTLTISAFIEDQSDLAKTTVTIAQGERKDVMLLPILKHSALSTLSEIRKATLHIDVRQISPFAKDIEHKTHMVRLMARNYALIAIRSENQRVIDLTKYLAAWVTPNHPEISRILSSARDYHPHKEFRGYQDGNTIEETADSVRTQVHAIFSALKYITQLTYANSLVQWEIQTDWITQKIRLPGECLAQGGVANCLEGTVLVASLLELIGIEPLLILVPGHAFVGWRVDHKAEQFEFLETTMISNGNFEQAQAYARDLYVQTQENRDFERELFHSPGFARRIDVLEHRRAGISPLE